MATTLAQKTAATTRPLAGAANAAWYGLAFLFAITVFYFVGFDQGATSVFGADSHIHEMLHDARHLLGFPCH